jgi:hypothetical protein
VCWISARRWHSASALLSATSSGADSSASCNLADGGRCLGRMLPFQSHVATACCMEAAQLPAKELNGQHVLAAALLAARRRQTGILRWWTGNCWPQHAAACQAV